MSQTIDEVRVPLGGKAYFAPKGTALPTQIELEDYDSVVPAAYVDLGLRTTDGAPEWKESPSAPIELFEDGNEVSANTGTVEVSMTLAQISTVILEAVTGTTYSAGGSADIDVDKIVEGVLWTDTLYRMGDGSEWMERKVAPARCTARVNSKDQRGNITGLTPTFSVKRSALLGNKHYRHALVEAA